MQSLFADGLRSNSLLHLKQEPDPVNTGVGKKKTINILANPLLNDLKTVV
jgi:hypothetical protein